MMKASVIFLISVLLFSSSLVGCISESDIDSDGISDKVDNCPDFFNPEQLDFDDDKVGDLCDTDDDNDGFLDQNDCLLYTSPSPRDRQKSRMPSSA